MNNALNYKTIAEYAFVREMITTTFPTGIVSLVGDSFDLWSVITEILPRLKEQILSRDGKLVIRPDSGDPVDIICGHSTDNLIKDGEKFYVKGKYNSYKDQFGSEVWGDYDKGKEVTVEERKGVIELLWDIYGGTVNEQGFKVLDPHIGAIYGDSINLERQIAIYERLAAKGFAATNIVLGIGSFTYQFNTRDTFGFAAKGAWFEVKNEDGTKTEYSIYKDPVTDDGTKKSLKGLLRVDYVDDYGQDSPEIKCFTEQTWLQESTGLLQTIYEDGKFYNQTSLTEIRSRIDKLVK
jgi:nicotinamide phosphoribosyltransferase